MLVRLCSYVPNEMALSAVWRLQLESHPTIIFISFFSYILFTRTYWNVSASSSGCQLATHRCQRGSQRGKQIANSMKHSHPMRRTNTTGRQQQQHPPSPDRPPKYRKRAQLSQPFTISSATLTTLDHHLAPLLVHPLSHSPTTLATPMDLSLRHP